MYQLATVIKTLSVAVASTCLVACSFGTSRSSSGQYTESTEKEKTPQFSKPEDLGLQPISVNQDNYYEVTSLALKAILLTDSGASALDRSAQVTRENAGIFGTASGVSINVDPLPCTEGGTVTINGEVTSNTQSSGPINFDNRLHWTFDSDFDNCSQSGNRLSGLIDVTFDMNLTELLNSSRYNFEASMNVSNLLMEEYNKPAVTISGSYQYSVESMDGVNVNTLIFTDDTTYYNDTDYQTFSYTLDKKVDTNIGEYTYQISSIFTANFLDSQYVEYRTLRPLEGQGHAYPSSGKIAIIGDEATVFATAMPGDVIFMEYDEGHDGSIDSTDYATWDDLVLDVTSPIHIGE